MSIVAIRAALETTLNGIAPALATGWENAPFTPTPGTPYQLVMLMPAPPVNPEIGPGYSELGLMQVSLFYPLNAGPAAAATRAQLIRTAFAYASTHTASGVNVHVTQTPEVGPARIEDDQYFLPVRIRYTAHIGA